MKKPLLPLNEVVAPIRSPRTRPGELVFGWKTSELPSGVAVSSLRDGVLGLWGPAVTLHVELSGREVAGPAI